MKILRLKPTYKDYGDSDTYEISGLTILVADHPFHVNVSPDCVIRHMNGERYHYYGLTGDYREANINSASKAYIFLPHKYGTSKFLYMYNPYLSTHMLYR